MFPSPKGDASRTPAKTNHDFGYEYDSKHPHQAIRIGLVWVACVGVFGPFGCGRRSHPSDDAMIANFDAKRREFERLQQMITEDVGLLRVSDEGTEPKAHRSVGVTRERIAQYRRLLRDVGARQIDISADRGTTELTASTVGFVTHGSIKGYVFDKNPDRTHVVGELDSMSSRGVGSGLRHIDGDWYLFFDGV